jgi:hypothetical protein
MLITPRGAVEQQGFRRIDEIVVGRRHRREIGDLAAVAASIRDDSPERKRRDSEWRDFKIDDDCLF